MSRFDRESLSLLEACVYLFRGRRLSQKALRRCLDGGSIPKSWLTSINVAAEFLGYQILLERLRAWGETEDALKKEISIAHMLSHHRFEVSSNIMRISAGVIGGPTFYDVRFRFSDIVDVRTDFGSYLLSKAKSSLPYFKSLHTGGFAANGQLKRKCYELAEELLPLVCDVPTRGRRTKLAGLVHEKLVVNGKPSFGTVYRYLAGTISRPK